MFRNLIKNKKAQNTAEYALLIALVIAGVIAMQTYAQRSLQARVRDASHYMTGAEGNGQTIGSTEQYEPYYLESSYNVARDSSSVKRLGENLTAQDSKSGRIRDAGGFEKSSYDNTINGIKGGV